MSINIFIPSMLHFGFRSRAYTVYPAPVAQTRLCKTIECISLKIQITFERHVTCNGARQYREAFRDFILIVIVIDVIEARWRKGTLRESCDRRSQDVEPTEVIQPHTRCEDFHSFNRYHGSVVLESISVWVYVCV